MNQDCRHYTNLIANRRRERKDVAKKSAIAVERLKTACDAIINACLSLIDKAGEGSFNRDNPLSSNMFLAAQFLQGEDISRMLILSGAYHQAGNLLKQETEIIVAMYEFRVGTRRDGSTAKFRDDMKKLGRKYGELNDIAHPTKSDVVELLNAKIEGDRVDPTLEVQFIEELCINFFGYHSLLVAIFSEELRAAIKGTMQLDFSDIEKNVVLNAIKTLEKEGAFHIKNHSSDSR